MPNGCWLTRLTITKLLPVDPLPRRGACSRRSDAASRGAGGGGRQRPHEQSAVSVTALPCKKTAWQRTEGSETRALVTSNSPAPPPWGSSYASSASAMRGRWLFGLTVLAAVAAAVFELPHHMPKATIARCRCTSWPWSRAHAVLPQQAPNSGMLLTPSKSLWAAPAGRSTPRATCASPSAAPPPPHRHSGCCGRSAWPAAVATRSWRCAIRYMPRAAAASTMASTSIAAEPAGPGAQEKFPCSDLQRAQPCSLPSFRVCAEMPHTARTPGTHARHRHSLSLARGAACY